MNVPQIIAYVISTNVPTYLIWCIYELIVYKTITFIPEAALIISLVVSMNQVVSMRKKLEHIPIHVDEMDMRGSDIMNSIMTALSYLFIFSFFLPEGIKGLRTDTLVIIASLIIQIVLTLLSSHIPYDLICLIRGYTYRMVKIGGNEYTILCKKKIRSRASFKKAVNPFHGFLIDVSK